MTNLLPNVGPDGPAQQVFSVTPADTLITHGATKALLCGTPGTLNGIDAAGNVFTDLPIQQGYNPLSVTQISTGGTASDIWALY